MDVQEALRGVLVVACTTMFFGALVIGSYVILRYLFSDFDDRHGISPAIQDIHSQLQQIEQAVQSADTTPGTDLLQQSWVSIKKMKEINDRIPDKRFSFQVDSLEQSAREICQQVKQDPEKMPQARQFFSSYLPLTIQLLETYDQLYHSSANGPNVQKAKRNIEENLDSIVVAFRQQVDQLFVNDSLEVMANLSALKTSMASAGLGVEDPFSIECSQ